MKAHKLEVLVIDMDGIGSDGVVSEIENNHYSNHCISPQVKSIKTVDIGEWSDDHPLNKHTTSDAEYDRLFRADRVVAGKITT